MILSNLSSGVLETCLVVGVTATRSGTTPEQYSSAANTLNLLKGRGFSWFVHGCCRGGDVEMDRVARKLGYFRWGWPADASVSPDDRIHIPDLDRVESSHPPLWRNVNGILKNAEVMLGLPNSIREKRRGSGTWATIRATRKAEKPLILIFPNGAVQEERTAALWA